jgi:hypothetical protein
MNFVQTRTSFSAAWCPILAMAFASVLGCGAGAEGDFQDPADDERGGDEVGTLEEGLNSSCGSFTPQATYTGIIASPGGQTVTAAQQSAGCQGNSFIFDVNSWNGSSYAGLTVAPSAYPNDQTTCETTDVRLYVWEKSGSTVTLISSAIKTGVWEGAFGCNLTLSNSLFAQGGHSYRIGVTARRPSTTNQSLVLTAVPVIH